MHLHLTVAALPAPGPWRVLASRLANGHHLRPAAHLQSVQGTATRVPFLRDILPAPRRGNWEAEAPCCPAWHRALSSLHSGAAPPPQPRPLTLRESLLHQSGLGLAALLGVHPTDPCPWRSPASLLPVWALCSRHLCPLSSCPLSLSTHMTSD